MSLAAGELLGLWTLSVLPALRSFLPNTSPTRAQLTLSYIAISKLSAASPLSSDATHGMHEVGAVPLDVLLGSDRPHKGL